MRFGYEQMANPYMLERSLYLGEFIKDSSGKLIQTYETKFSKSGEMYLRKMSKYLSSIRYFPEYTGIGGKYTVPKAKAILGLSKNNELGNYMD